jgi:hypothetical protein
VNKHRRNRGIDKYILLCIFTSGRWGHGGCIGFVLSFAVFFLLEVFPPFWRFLIFIFGAFFWTTSNSTLYTMTLRIQFFLFCVIFAYFLSYFRYWQNIWGDIWESTVSSCSRRCKRCYNRRRIISIVRTFRLRLVVDGKLSGGRVKPIVSRISWQESRLCSHVHIHWPHICFRKPLTAVSIVATPNKHSIRKKVTTHPGWLHIHFLAPSSQY